MLIVKFFISSGNVITMFQEASYILQVFKTEVSLVETDLGY